ncbi:NERD domain-containing protein [Planctomycetota bacterium]|nr:NERD domain-containing protein [Planctomycetota bacterium]
MGRLYPMLTETQLEELPSQAEATVYRALRDALDDSYLVIHGKSYVASRRDGGHRDGEADFVIFSAQHGLLTIEVKGGGVSYHPETGWQSIDRFSKFHTIKDPIAQARSQKFAFLNQLKSNQEWVRLRRRIPMGHAVLLPDVNSVGDLSLPESPHEIIGGGNELRNIHDWLTSVYQFWVGSDNVPLGPDGLELAERILCHPIEVRPMVRDVLDADNRLRLRLTDQQAAILRTLNRFKRAGIIGAAGTGKTILAVEKAKTLAALGKKVLMLCYNRALSVTLARQVESSSKIFACNFHQFCQHCVKKCIEKGKPDPLARAKVEYPHENYWSIQLPLAAFYGIEEIGDELQFDAIVVDEGQDFGEEYWLPIEMALISSSESWLYVFYDENQRLYSRVSSFPIPESETFLLTKNCRNSKPVHDLAYRYYDGDSVDDSGIDGNAPERLEAQSLESQSKKISREITRLIHLEGVSPESIAVLVTGTQKEEFYDLLLQEPLPRPAKWSREEHFKNGSVLLDTVKRFKGLERDVIFLWIEEAAALDTSQMYVGISRARSILYFVGNSNTMNLIAD